MTSDVSTYARRTGAKMRAVRKARGMSLKGIQEASCGQFKAVLIGSWERADRVPGMEKLQAYADWLGVDIFSLLPPSEGVQAWRYSIADQAAAKAVREVANLCRASPGDAAAMVVTALKGPEAEQAADDRDAAA